MTHCEATGGRGGRPRRRLIENPGATRALGRERFLEAQRDHKRNPYYHGKRRRAPMAPTDRWDEGLVYASRAGLIAATSVRALARKARIQAWVFRQLFRRYRGAAGPARDSLHATELWVAIQFVKKATRHAERQGIGAGTSEHADVRDALELLFERNVSEGAVKKQRQRLRRRLGVVRGERRAGR